MTLETFELILQLSYGRRYRDRYRKLTTCRFSMEKFSEIVAKLPDDIVAFVTQNVWFLSSMEDAWAFTFTGSDIKDHHLIFLSDELFIEDQIQIYFTIAHEIGHVIMGHKNSILINQSKEEIRQQEREANAFARKYLS